MLKPRIHTFSPAYPEYKDHTISNNFVQIVEKAQLFSVAEKIELLALYLNKKMTTEIYMNIPFPLQGEIEMADQSFLNKLEEEVKELGLPYFIDRYTKLNRTTGNQREFVWFQVSRNQLVSDYLEKNNNTLSDPDYGVLYGFPTTATQAFLGFIPAAEKAPQTIGCYYFGGVYSKEHIADEQKYYDSLWEELSVLSPVIAQQAEVNYRKHL